MGSGGKKKTVATPQLQAKRDLLRALRGPANNNKARLLAAQHLTASEKEFQKERVRQHGEQRYT